MNAHRAPGIPGGTPARVPPPDTKERKKKGEFVFSFFLFLSFRSEEPIAPQGTEPNVAWPFELSIVLDIDGFGVILVCCLVFVSGRLAFWSVVRSSVFCSVCLCWSVSEVDFCPLVRAVFFLFLEVCKVLVFETSCRLNEGWLDGVSPEPTLRSLLRERSKRVRQWESCSCCVGEVGLVRNVFCRVFSMEGFGLLPSVSSEERVSKFIFAEKSSPSTWWSFESFVAVGSASHTAPSLFLRLLHESTPSVCSTRSFP